MRLAPMWCHPLRRDIVMVHGPDAQTYLHSQLSQEIRDLAVGQARWSFVLQPTGKVDALVRVLRSGEAAYVLDVDGGWGEALVARLNRFRIRVKADVEPIGWQAVAVRGEGEPPVVPGAVAVPAWPGTPGVDLLGPAVDAAATGLPVVDRDVYERARILAGWPAMGAELDADTIPATTGVVPFAVSFTKGCYPGQELVERIDSRGGNVPRHLRRLVVAGPGTIEVGAPVRASGVEIGRVTSTAGDVALAYLGRSVAVGESVEAGGVTVRVEAALPER